MLHQSKRYFEILNTLLLIVEKIEGRTFCLKDEWLLASLRYFVQALIFRYLVDRSWIGVWSGNLLNLFWQDAVLFALGFHDVHVQILTDKDLSCHITKACYPDSVYRC